jgi:hypothetical protein
VTRAWQLDHASGWDTAHKVVDPVVDSLRDDPIVGGHGCTLDVVQRRIYRSAGTVARSQRIIDDDEHRYANT